MLLRKLACIAFLTLLPGTALASAWTRAKGTGYAKIWDRSLIGKQAYIQGRETAALPSTYQDHQLGLYGEWGVTDDLTLVLNATPFGVARYAGNTDPYIGGLVLAGRYQLVRGPMMVAGELHAGGRPSKSEDTGTAVVDGRELIINPVVGTLLGGAAVHVGTGFTWGWLTGHAGARFHSAEALHPALYAGLQLGWHALKSLDLALHVNLWHALGAIEPIQVLGSGQTRYLGFGLGLTWWMTQRVGLHAGLDGVAYAYANAATPSLLLGVELR
ncbi:MAG: hypothetical protein H6730_09875 [Deltaproteobacteria bacterium]|nr:hypothetical protein [Deltaproteobacteria bacterium]